MPRWLPDILIVVILGVALVFVYRAKEDDPGWAKRWRALSPADRARIARAARSGAMLPSQEEVELAAGSLAMIVAAARPTP